MRRQKNKFDKTYKQNGQESEPVVFLKGRKTILRPISTDDAPLLQRWINDPQVRIYLMTIFPVTIMEELEWVNTHTKRSEKDIVFIIEVKGKPIGIMGIHGINWQSRTGTTGAFIGEKSYWGKGYGTDAKMVLLKYAFDTLGLRKIMSRVKEFNKRSLAYSLHCGYKEEGRLRKQFLVDGEYYDEIILGVFREEWLPYWKEHAKAKA